MSCRVITSPITGKEETSILWNEIRDVSISDEQADEIYNETTSEPFIEKFGNWIEEPESIDKSKVNSIGEPKIEYLELPDTYFQADEAKITPSKASPETITRVKEWLSRVGVNIEELDTAKYKGINGVADILNNLIQLAEGKESEALTEEAMHFAVEIMKVTNPALYRKMLNNVGNYQVYKDLLNNPIYTKQFTKQGQLDVIGLKQEAMGKILAETLVRSEQDTIEKPEFLEQSRAWWKQILDWFKSLVAKAGYNPFEKAIEGLNNIGTVESLNKRKELLRLGLKIDAIPPVNTDVFQDQINRGLDDRDYRSVVSLIAQQLTPETFQKVVDTYLNGDMQLGYDIQNFAKVYLQAAPVENPTADEVIAKFKRMQTDFNLVKHEESTDPDDENNNSYYTVTINGEVKKTGRTTEWAKLQNIKNNHGRDYFKNATPEQKAEWAKKAMTGTKLHNFLEETIKVFLNDDNTIKSEDEVDLSTLPSANGPILTKLQDWLLGDTRKGINGFLFQFPAGTKIVTEQRVYNPSAKNEDKELAGRAGTMDLVVFLPDGKVKVYDWKFMGFSQDKIDQAPQKKQQHSLQLADYRKTLKEAYGIKDVELQTVPFGAVYQMKEVDGKRTPVLKSVVTGNINVRDEKNTFLLPVVPTDQSSGNLKVDSLVKSLQAHYKKLYDKPVSPEEKYLKNPALNQLSIAIRNLQVALNFEPLAAEASTFKQNILDTLDKYIDIDTTTLTQEETNKQINELLDLLKSADTYSNLDEVFISEYGDENLDKDKERILQNLRVSSATAKDSKGQITDLLKKYVTAAALREGFSPTQVLSATKEVQGIVNSFLEGTKLPNATMNLAAKIVLEARSNDKRVIAAEIEEFGKLYTALQKVSPIDPFKAIGDGNELKRKIKTEFYTALNKAFKDGDTKFILENTDNEKLKELITDLIQKRFDQIDSTTYTTDEEENYKERERHKKIVMNDFNMFNPITFTGFENNQFQGIVKKAIIEEPHYTDEYRALLKQPEALAMYNFLTEMNRRAFSQGYLGQGHSMRFFPFVLATTIERLTQSENVFGAAHSTLKDAFTVQKDEEVSYGKIDPETGKLLKTIPKFFTQTGNKSQDQLSTDLLKVIPLYIRALREFETSKELEMTLLAMHTVEKAKGHFEVENNQVIFENDKPKVFDTNEVNAKVLEVMTDDAIYGIKEEGDTLLDTAISKTTKGTEEEKTQRKLSAKKTVEKLNTHTQGLAVGLKAMVAIPNFVGNFMQATVNAGLYYTVPEYLSNFKNVVGSIFQGKEGNVMKGLMDMIVPLNEDAVKEGQHKIGWKQSPVKWLSTWSFQDALMSTNRIGDVAHQLTNAYSWVKNSMVVDGKIVNIRQYILEKYANRYSDPSTLKQVERDMEEEIKSLKENSSLPKVAKFNTKGMLEIPGVSQEEISRYRTKVVEFGRNITGQMSMENKAEYRRNVIARSFMMFKNWIPKQVSLRTLDIKKDPVLGNWEYGRTRLFMKTVMHLGFANILKMKQLLDATPEGLGIMREMLDQKRDDYYKKTGQQLDITEAEFFDMVRKELRAEMKELAILFSVIGLVIAAKVAQPPDDEDDLTKNRYRFWAKAINKISDEMWFYYNPTSAESITRGSILPSLGLLSKATKVLTSFEEESRGYVTGDEELQDKEHPLKYFLNLFPVASPFQNEILPIVFPEAAKDMGIQTTSQARAMR